MNIIEIITKLENVDAGVLYKECLKKGLIPCGFARQYEIYLEYDKEMKTTKKSSTQIVSDVSECFKVSERRVYKIIKNFKA